MARIFQRRFVPVLQVLVSLVAGLAVGVGVYTFHYARGASYFSTDPAACANCHIMNEQYNGWSRGSHRNVAACNDCHTPPDVIEKCTTKALNGFMHSYAFTTGDFPEPIVITDRNHQVTEKACRGCHQEIVHVISPEGEESPVSCLQCHVSVGHL